VKSTGSEAGGSLFLQTHSVNVEIPDSVASKKADNVILGVAIHLKEKFPKREVVLVSKDINMRIKAHAVGIPAEDYFNDKVLEDTDLLYTGSCSCRRTSGTATARTWRAGRSTAARSTASAARWCPR
jgi:PhoH-like ATPase